LKKTILEIYALAVCFVAVAFFAGFLGQTLYGAVQVANPAFTLDKFQYSTFQSNEAFRRRMDLMPVGLGNEQRMWTNEELTRLREAGYAQALGVEERDGKQSLLHMAIFMLIAAIAFFAHWRIAARARQNGA